MRKKIVPAGVDPVQIRPLFGLRPGVWLTMVYIIAIIVLVFLVGFLPGILKGRKRVAFSSAAGAAAVYIDGLYAGGTPFTTWVSSGVHEVEFRVAGSTIERAGLKVGHPVFLTWLFPRRMAFQGTQGVPAELREPLTRLFLSDVERQSAVTAYDERHVCPPLFQDFKARGFEPDRGALALAFAHITSLEMLDDARNAFGDGGLGDLGVLGFALQEELFGQKKDEALEGGFRAGQKAVPGSVVFHDDQLRSDGLAVAGRRFEGGAFPMGRFQSSLDYQSSVSALVSREVAEPFSLACREVTESQYALFLRDNPSWRASNREALVREGLVDERYLEGVNTSLVYPSNKSVRNVSLHAAEAFCAWLSKRSGREVFIPSEEQWSAAFSTLEAPKVQRSLLAPGSGGLDSMLGGVWELTSSPFIPLERAVEVLDPALHESLEDACGRWGLRGDVVAKGGCYLDAPGSADGAKRGVVGRSLCADTVGFRIAWK